MVNLLKEYSKVELFEAQLSRYTGAPYVVCVDSCTNALLLCLQYCKPKSIILPTDTYVGVAMSALHAGVDIEFKKENWSGIYRLTPTNIYDAAKRFTQNMYIPKSYMCLSFHYKKHLKIGRGGAILTDNRKAYNWFLLARNSGRCIDQPLHKQIYKVAGHNMLLHPDLAAKGSRLLKKIKLRNCDLPYEYYGDLSEQILLD